MGHMENGIIKWIKQTYSNGIYFFNNIVHKTTFIPQSSHDTGPDHGGAKRSEKCGHPTKVRIFQTKMRPGVSNIELESTLESPLELESTL